MYVYLYGLCNRTHLYVFRCAHGLHHYTQYKYMYLRQRVQLPRPGERFRIFRLSLSLLGGYIDSPCPD